MITVLVVDDHALVRMGIRRLLDDVPDITIVGEADSGEVALSSAKLLQPDVMFLDMKMPGMDGWEVTRRLKKTNPGIKIIVLTSVTTDPFPGRLLQLGAMGYLTKESSMEEMVLAIRKVMQGQRYLSTVIAQKIAINSLDDASKSPFEGLSEREMQVMLMLARGLSVPKIASLLFLSTKTVNGYRYRMFEKLGVNNDVELIYLAMQHRVIPAPTDVV